MSAALIQAVEANVGRSRVDGEYLVIAPGEPAPPKSECPLGPTCLEPGVMHTRSRSGLEIYKNPRDIF